MKDKKRGIRVVDRGSWTEMLILLKRGARARVRGLWKMKTERKRFEIQRDARCRCKSSDRLVHYSVFEI